MNATESNGLIAQLLRDPNSTVNAIGADVVDHLYELVPWIALVLLSLAAVLMSLMTLKRWQTDRICRGAVSLEITLPPEVNETGAFTFWTNLHDLLRPNWKRFFYGQPHLGFELSWQGPSLAVHLWIPREVSVRLVRQAVSAAWPGAGIIEHESAVVPLASANRCSGGELRLNVPEHFSIEHKHDADPLRTIIAAIGELNEDQSAVVQVLARPVTGRRTARCLKAAKALKAGTSSSTTLRLLDAITGTPKIQTDDPNKAAEIRAITAKANSLGWEAVIRYGVGDSRAQRYVDASLKSRSHGLASAFALYAGRNRFRRCKIKQPGIALAQRSLRKADLLSVLELAAVAHLPTDLVIPGATRAGARTVPPSPLLATVGKVIGHAEGGSQRPVALSPLDGRYHLHVLGATGSGKSTLMTNLILQDFAAKRGAVVIDPKGDLIEDVLDRLPQNAAERVVLLDSSRPEIAPSLDVLAGTDKHLVVDNIVGIFHRIFEAYWGPRTDDVLRAACLTLVQRSSEPPNLAEIPLLLSNADFRRRATVGLDDPIGLGGFWAWYEGLSDAQQGQVVGPVMNKLRAFLLRDFVREVVGSGARPLDMNKILDGGLLLVRIPKGVVGDETAKLIGSLIVAKVWQTATARSAVKGSVRRDAALYVDECQNFLNLPRSFDEMLAEARGYGLSLVLAHQHLGQLSRELRDAISANARNKVFFNMSPEDAHLLERHVTPELSKHDLSHLGAYQLALRLVADGREQPACTVISSPPSTVEDDVDNAGQLISAMKKLQTNNSRQTNRALGIDQKLKRRQ